MGEIGIILFFLAINGVLVTWLGRKLGADLQARIGPKLVGALGLWQPIADTIKLLGKHERNQTSAVEKEKGKSVWMVLYFFSFLSMLAVIPIASSLLINDLEIGCILPFFSAMVLAVGTLVLGIDFTAPFSRINSIRLASQVILGLFPALVALLTLGTAAKTLRWSELVQSQGFLLWEWSAFKSPFLLIAFFVFVLSGLVIWIAPPFDGGLFLDGSKGGMAALAGPRLEIFYLTRFYCSLYWGLIVVQLFLGGWHLPSGFAASTRYILEFGWVALKLLSLSLIVSCLARVTPRVRFDQMSNFVARVLCPLSLLALLGQTFLSLLRSD